MQQEARDLLRESEGRMQLKLLMLGNNPENQGDWLAWWYHQ
jgi:hypothetical protein